MKRFKKLLVPLQLAESDRAVLAMTSSIASRAESAEIQFVHHTRQALIPPGLTEAHPGMLEAANAEAMEKLQESVMRYAELPAETVCSFEVEPGNPVQSCLTRILAGDFDLVVIGSDPVQNAIRLARKASCSVCVVPANAPTLAQKPLVAVDFSGHSRYACEVAFALSEAPGASPAELLHVCQIHAGYKWSTLSREEFIASNESYATLAMKQFLLGLDRPQDSLTTHIHHHESVPFGILDFAEKHGFDCIVAGCRGKDALSALLLGSDIETVISHSPMPVLAVKIKGTGRTFLQELLGMSE